MIIQATLYIDFTVMPLDSIEPIMPKLLVEKFSEMSIRETLYLMKCMKKSVAESSLIMAPDIVL
ncbi:hypothetical protein D3C86_1765180 [compost metagenome]